MADLRDPETGVTLIEVLVVLTLIAVAAGVVTLSLPNRASDRSVGQEAALLVSRLNLVAERSVVEGQTFRLTWGAQDYGFSVWVDGDWQASQNPALPAEHELQAGALRTVQSVTDVVITPDLLPPQSGALEWRMVGGASETALRFDGFRAEMGSGQ